MAIPTPADAHSSIVAESTAATMVREIPAGAVRAAAAHFEMSNFRNAAELEQVWLDLEQRAIAPFFLSWNWIGCWVREASLDPAVLIGRAEGRIVLLGILTPSTRRNLLPAAVHGLQLHMTGDPQKDVITIEYNGFLVDHSWVGKIEAKAIAFLLSAIRVEAHRRDELHLKNVPAEFENSVLASGFHFREVQRKPSWRIDLAAIRAAGKRHLDCLSANTRQQIRRSIRLYQKRGRLEIVRARDVPEALEFLDGLKNLHQSYWNSRGEPGAFSYPFFERFQLRLIQTCLGHGTVEVLKISAGADAIGYVYNLVYHGHVYQYQTGFLYESDPRLKPGLVSHCLCIDRHLDEGSKVYDFMAGEARYKSNLGEPGPDMLYLLAERPTWPLQLEGALHGVKRWLGSVGLRLRARPD
ncbi:MAG TPA: GNAT family N-acetyltransferase [Acetobacteraceae bacterium]|nr:GNAT family N-acetyltransferase [Acetobacteraceae bacterium]